jgi:hypothetical protein
VLTIPAGKNPRWVALGDLNGDGHLDLVLADIGLPGLSVVLGHGDGTFAAPAAYPSLSPLPISPAASPLALGDFNGDGKLDAAMAHPGGVGVFLNHGDGTFAGEVVYPTSGSAGALVAGDLNGDGQLDLAFCGGNANVTVLPNLGDGTFAAPVAIPAGGAGCTSLAIGDLNGDGKLDLVVGNRFSQFVTGTLLLNHGDGTFAPPASLGTSVQPFGLAVGDLNGDGVPDVAGAYTNVTVALDEGNATFAPSTSYPLMTVGHQVVIADVNGDGRPDLVVGDGDFASVLLNQGQGAFGPRRSFSLPGLFALSGAVGDLNEDGRPDIAVAGESEFAGVLFNVCTP